MKLCGILCAGVLLFAAPSFAQEHHVAHPSPTAEESTHYSWADVLRADPVYDDSDAGTSTAPDCLEQPAAPPPPPAHSDNRAGGTVLGALIGGVIGNLFGKGDGRVATTAAGAVAGGVVGNQIASAQDDNEAEAVKRSLQEAPHTPENSVRDCREARASQQRRIIGYDVEYRYKGEIYLARLPYDPGDRLRVKISVTPAD